MFVYLFLINPKPTTTKMKTLFSRIPLYVTLVAVLAIGCKDLANVSLSPNFTIDFTVNEPTETHFLKDQVLDGDSVSSELNKYRNNIKSVEVTKVTYFLPYFTGGAGQTLQSGEVKVINPTTNAEMVLATLTNVNLASVAAKETDLTTDKAAVNMLADLLKNDPHKVKVRLSGVVNEAPINLIARLTVYTKVTASPL